MKLRQWLNALRTSLFGDTRGSLNTPPNSSKTTGKRGESIALRYLQRSGWRLIERNLRLGSDELDLLVVSPDEQIMSVVEVRTTMNSYRSPERTITARKRATMLRVADKLRGVARKHRCTLRVDVIAVTLTSPEPLIRHYESVFPLPRERFFT